MSVALFIPCLVDQFYPEIGESVVDLMERVGANFTYPEEQTCCGLPFFNMGQWDAAVRPAMHFIDVFENYEAVVTPSSSCASMVKHFFAKLFKDDREMLERAEALAGRTHELASWLVREAKRPELGAAFEGTVACHRSCHLRELEAGDEAEQLIRGVAGAKLIALPRTEVCCGFGGAFSIKFPVLSGAMGATKCDTFDDCKADCIVTTDAGCMLQINGILHRRGAPRRVWHLAELLAGRVKAEAKA